MFNDNVNVNNKMKGGLRLSDIIILESKDELARIPEGKVLINTINAYSYNLAQKDDVFAASLAKGDYLIPDGVAIVKACKWLKAKSQPKERIAGWDLFVFEMKRLNETLSDASLRYADATIRGDATTKRHEGAYETERGSYETLRYDNEEIEVKKRVMFMGSSERVLSLIKERAAVDYPNVEVVTYSPPYKEVFSEEDNRIIIEAINRAKPDLLWIGMTAPKQEKWTYEHWEELDINCHVGTIGAVFDFYAGTAQRAPIWWQKCGLEWLYRLMKEPKRMWRRYIIGNPQFVWNVVRE